VGEAEIRRSKQRFSIGKYRENKDIPLPLFMLVSALMGRERMQAVYAHAITEGYRFYSYGDSSLLLPA